MTNGTRTIRVKSWVDSTHRWTDVSWTYFRGRDLILGDGRYHLVASNLEWIRWILSVVPRQQRRSKIVGKCKRSAVLQGIFFTRRSRRTLRIDELRIICDPRLPYRRPRKYRKGRYGRAKKSDN